MVADINTKLYIMDKKIKCPICGEDVELATNEEFNQFSFEDDIEKVGCPNCHCFTQGRESLNYTISCKNVKMSISKLVSHGMIEGKLISYTKRIKDLGQVMCDLGKMLSFFPKEEQSNDEWLKLKKNLAVDINQPFFLLLLKCYMY